ncbi:MAG TPA: 4Fe-4S binding protein [Gammaproteobacteria bacterium]|nr:4Fe-4S binding protein [Gammaproteobacteria bacterium]
MILHRARFSVSRALAIAAMALISAAPVAAEPAYAERARNMFPNADHVGALSGTPPAAEIGRGGRLMGYVLLTNQVAPIPAYSGKPISVLVGIDTAGVIRGAEIVDHEEPILVIGVTDDALSAFTAQYAGRSVSDKFKIGGRERPDTVVLDGISGATITMMVLNASILRSVEAVAESRGLPLAPDAEAQVAAATERMAAARPPEATQAGATALEPIWKEVWAERTPRLWLLGVGLLVLTVILFLQDWLTRYRRLVSTLRIAFLFYTLLFIGVYALAQLSVVNVLTFLHAAVRDFRWDIFLIEPLIFVLWSFVAVSLLLWGRGVFCGWLCPYGALQELVNKAAQSMRVPQLPLPALVHERLVAVKYVILLALFGLSLQSLPDAVRFAEVEPFKTVFALRLDRPWPFVAYALGLVAISAFNGKFFCKYLCPLGAALTIPSHFRIFDWLRRRKECGRPCQTCATECPSQAIRPTGEIDANECHYCLDCQVIFWDPYKCPPLVERRKRAEKHGRTLDKLPLR